MEKKLLIRASAGSGKTYKLSLRYLGLLAKGVGVQSILASTFTRKAAGEIQTRVLLQCAEACLDERKRSEMSKSICKALTREDMFAILRNLTSNLHRMRVMTLDGFFNRIATCFTYEMGLEPGWRILEDAEDASLRREAIRRTIQRDPELALAIVRGMSPGDVSSRVAQQIFSAVDALFGLYQESDAAAWDALSELKLAGRLDEAAYVHALDLLESGVELVRTLPANRKLPERLEEILAEARVGNFNALLGMTLIQNALKTGPVLYYRKELPEQVAEPLRRLARHAVVGYFDRLRERTRSTYNMISEFAVQYEQVKREANALRFEDVTREVARFVGGLRSLAPIYWRMDSSIEHLLLDEFQDTSLDQWRILRPMSVYCCAPNTRRSFFCVGDGKQAIYRWRNGRAEIFDSVTRTFAGITESSSNVSWRSSPVIINAVNRVFFDEEKQPEAQAAPANFALGGEPIPMRDVLTGDYRDAWDLWKYEFHSTARSGYPGYWELVTAPTPAQAQGDAEDDVAGLSDDAPDPGEDADPEAPSISQQECTLRYAADRIAELYRTLGTHSIGVLMRHNEPLQRLIQYLRERNVPASEDGKNPLTTSAAVRVILALLQMVEHPGDSVARFHFAHSPLGGQYPALGWSPPWEEAAWTPERREHVERERARCLHDFRRQFAAFGFGRVLERVVERYMPLLEAPEVRRLQQLVKLAGEYDAGKTRSGIPAFMAHVEKTRLADPTCARVSVMSIHMAKGLQFDAVVLPELDFTLAGRTPQFVSGYQDDDVTQNVKLVTSWISAKVRKAVLEPDSPFARAMALNVRERVSESLCLLYVAMTRAVHALYLIVPPDMPKKPKETATAAGKILLRTLAGATSAEPETRIAADGHPERYLKTARARCSEVDVAPASCVPPAARELRFLPGDGSCRSLQRRSPSNIEDRETVDLARKLSFRQANTVNGTILHSWYEKIVWLETSLPSDEELIRAAVPYGLARDTIDHLLRNFHNSVKNQNLQSVLKWTEYIPMLRERVIASGVLPPEQVPGTIYRTDASDPEEIRWEVFREKELAIRTERELLLGTVDRLLLLRNDFQVFWADCVDYKTTRKMPDPDVFEALIRKHSLQMADYRQMLATHYGLPSGRVSVRLVFSMLGVVREV